VTDVNGTVDALIGLGLLLSALYLQSESFLDPMVDGIAAQSLLLAALLGWLAYADQSVELAVVAVFVFALRVLIIPYILRRQIRAFRWRAREIRASQRVAGHALLAVVFAIATWFVFQETLASALPALPGIALPFVLLVEGLLMLATRTNTLVQVIGYLEEENAIVYAGVLFVVAFPLLIEVVVFLDVLGVVLVSIILSIQRSVIGIPEEELLEELTG
jgi:hydrogenase-4 component E